VLLAGACGADTVFVFAQVGDGTTTNRNTPVPVSGLSSGVAMVALGYVRSVCDCCEAGVCEGAGFLCITFGLFGCIVKYQSFES
jgi:hypothetical protein